MAAAWFFRGGRSRGHGIVVVIKWGDAETVGRAPSAGWTVGRCGCLWRGHNSGVALPVGNIADAGGVGNTVKCSFTDNPFAIGVA